MFFPATPFISTFLFINFRNFCQPPRLLHPRPLLFYVEICQPPCLFSPFPSPAPFYLKLESNTYLTSSSFSTKERKGCATGIPWSNLSVVGIPVLKALIYLSKYKRTSMSDCCPILSYLKSAPSNFPNCKILKVLLLKKCPYWKNQKCLNLGPKFLIWVNLGWKFKNVLWYWKPASFNLSKKWAFKGKYSYNYSRKYGTGAKGKGVGEEDMDVCSGRGAH